MITSLVLVDVNYNLRLGIDYCMLSVLHCENII